MANQQHSPSLLFNFPATFIIHRRMSSWQKVQSILGNHDVVLVKHNQTRSSHDNASNSKSPFASIGIKVTMHKLNRGVNNTTTPGASWETAPPPTVSAEGALVLFCGQFGLIDFDTSIRLPRHVHIVPPSDISENEVERQGRAFVTERILVHNGVALVEFNGKVYVVPPRIIVTSAPGVPYTWTSCPPNGYFSGSCEATKRGGDVYQCNLGCDTYRIVSDFRWNIFGGLRVWNRDWLPSDRADRNTYVGQSICKMQ